MTSKLILGTVQMGLPYGINNTSGRLSKCESFEILETAYSYGVRTLDTAEVYGIAHKVIGEFHKENPQNKFGVITKIPKNSSLINTKEKIFKYTDELNIECPIAIMFHSYKSYEENTQLRGELINLKEEGLFNNLGVSVYTNQELEKVIRDQAVDLIQLPFNVFDNISVRGRLLKMAREWDKTIHTRSVFLQGLFFKNPEEDHQVVKQLAKPMKRLYAISKKYNISIATLALLYCLNQELIDKVIIGVDSIDQLETNLSICNEILPQHVINELDHIKIENENFLNPSMWP